MLSFASGCRAVEVLVLRGRRGDDRRGETGKIDLFGSSAKDRRLDAVLVLASASEFTRDCGPNEKEVLIECRGREPEGDGSLGMGGMLKPLAGGGVEVIAETRRARRGRRASEVIQ